MVGPLSYSLGKGQWGQTGVTNEKEKVKKRKKIKRTKEVCILGKKLVNSFLIGRRGRLATNPPGSYQEERRGKILKS